MNQWTAENLNYRENVAADAARDTQVVDNTPLAEDSVWLPWSVIFAAIVLVAILIAVLLPEPNPNQAYCVAICFGFTFGSISLLSIWSAFESVAGRRRITVIGMGVVAASFSFYVLRSNGPLSVVLPGLFGIAAQFAVVGVLLLLLRHRSKYRFADARDWERRTQDSGSDWETASSTQFTIGNLFWATTGCAVLLSLLRFVVPMIDFDRGAGGSEEIWVWIPIFGIIALTGIAMTLCVLHLSYRFRLPAAMLYTGVLIALTALLTWPFAALLPFSDRSEAIMISVPMALLIVGIPGCALVFLRCCGRRLIRDIAAGA
ncbi:MAG: hypothetical protein AAF958_17090 [Planctomycetota bacterium]